MNKRETAKFIRTIAHSPLLAAKLKMPASGSHLVYRPRLSARLDDGVRAKLTLVVAPAGYGKTTAVTEWSRRRAADSGWVSLDSGDNDPVQFWNYLIAALEPVLPGLGGKTPHFPHPLDSSRLKTLITMLTDDVSKQSIDFVLVLDNYHLINEPAIHRKIIFLLQYLPENLHLVLISRCVPPLDLPRLQASGQMKEIGARDLRFTPDEVAAFYLQRSLRLSVDEVEIMETRTEGWIAGLCIAALAMERQGDPGHFVRGFCGVNHDIAAYLNQEVFQSWPGDIRDFLLQTSLLNSFTGDLCTAVTGCGDSGEVLETLADGNSFIVTLDRERRWYRYHHLFAEFLRDLLCKKHGPSITLLHKKAGLWYEQNGHIAEAISHYLVGNDFYRAAALIEQHGPEILKAGEVTVLLDILNMLPDAVIEGNPILCLLYAWTLIMSCEVKEAERWLGQVEQLCLNSRLALDTRDKLLGEVALARANSSYHDFGRAKELLAEARRLLPEGSGFLHFGIWVKTGMLSILRGLYDHTWNLRGVEPFYSEIQELNKKMGCEHSCLTHPVAAGEVYYEWNNLDKAMRLALEGIRFAEAAGEAGILIPGLHVLVRIRRARGDLDGALDTAREAEKKAYAMNALHCLPQLAALKIRLYLDRGELEPVESWLLHNHLRIHDRPTIERKYELITLARVLMARQKWDQALLCLTNLLAFAEEKNRQAALIEILNLQAMVYQAQGEQEKAMASLRKSLALGEAGDFLRIFIDEGHSMLGLLTGFASWQRQHRLLKTGVSGQYVKKLIRLMKDSALNGLYGPAAPGKTLLRQTEALTRREVEVLRLLAQGLTYREIAERLTVSMSTVKTHTGNIFSKLGVNNRTLAVERGREFNIL